MYCNVCMYVCMYVYVCMYAWHGLDQYEIEGWVVEDRCAPGKGVLLRIRRCSMVLDCLPSCPTSLSRMKETRIRKDQIYLVSDLEIEFPCKPATNEKCCWTKNGLDERKILTNMVVFMLNEEWSRPVEPATNEKYRDR